MTSLIPSKYPSEGSENGNPTPLPPSVSEHIPYFVTDSQPAPVLGSIPVETPNATTGTTMNSIQVQSQQILPTSSMANSIATAETVQALGLPMFLVGQNVHVLQTLITSPGLLSSYVDINGVYDQARILNLVQTLSQNLSSATQPIVQDHVALDIANFHRQTMNHQYNTSQATSYQPAPQKLSYTPTQVIQSQIRSKVGYRGDQNSLHANLHISGYGPMTTPESIIALFEPYVKVDEIVPKNGFMFVNTSDPEGAKRARESLNGVVIGGQPLRINAALRRNKTLTSDLNGYTGTKNARTSHTTAVPLPRDALGQIDYGAVRDDRGNPATKNLFVAGYGQGTTEQDLRDIFNQQCQVTGVVMKGRFSFVNTTEMTAAVHARETLTGSVVKGGVLQINFAKESGRLGLRFGQNFNASSTSQPQGKYYTQTF